MILKQKTVTIPIYFGKIRLFIVEEMDDLSPVFKCDMSGCHSGVSFKDDKSGNYVIAFQQKISLDLIVHEIIHLVNLVFIDRGVKLDLHNDEPQTYFAGWVAEQVDIFINGKSKILTFEN